MLTGHYHALLRDTLHEGRWTAEQAAANAPPPSVAKGQVQSVVLH